LLFVIEHAVRSFFAIKPSRKKSTLAQAGVIIWIHKSMKHNCLHKRERIIEVKIKMKRKTITFLESTARKMKDLKKTKTYKKLQEILTL